MSSSEGTGGWCAGTRAAVDWLDTMAATGCRPAAGCCWRGVPSAAWQRGSFEATAAAAVRRRDCNSASASASARLIFRPSCGIGERQTGQQGCWPSCRAATIHSDMQESIKLWPHGTVTGSEHWSRQMQHVSIVLVCDERRPSNATPPLRTLSNPPNLTTTVTSTCCDFLS